MADFNSQSTSTAPAILPHEMPRWNVLLRAYLKGRDQSDRVLDKDKPKMNRELYQSYLSPAGIKTARSKAYKRDIQAKIKLWDKRNGKALAAIVEACRNNATAFNIVMTNPKATAKDLYQKLFDRLDLKETSVIQAKLADFNSLTIQSTETAEDFINRILNMKIALCALGCDYITDDIHCLGRLKDGLMKDERYEKIALTLLCSGNLTWDQAVTNVLSFDRTRVTTLVTPKDSVKFARTAKSKKKLHQSGKTKSTGRKVKRCSFCNKIGHTYDECRLRLKDKSSKLKCFICNGDHYCKNCPLRKEMQQLVSKRNKSDEKAISDLDSEKSFMLRSQDFKTNGNTSRKLVGDSGATSHMVRESSIESRKTENFSYEQKHIDTAQNGISFNSNAKCDSGRLSNVLVCEDNVLAEDILSIPKLDRDGNYILMGGGQAKVFDSNMKLIATAPLEQNAYRFNADDFLGEKVRLADASPRDDLTLWHRRLGHHSRRRLAHAIKHKLLSGITGDFKNSKVGLCSCCVKAKSTRHSFSNSTVSAPATVKVLVPRSSTVVRVDTDIKGPFSVLGRKGEQYFQIFVERDSKYKTVMSLKTRDQAVNNVRDYIDIHLAREGQKVLEYHSDGAPELISRVIMEFLASKGCKLSFSPSHTPELNGLSERSIRTVWESAFALLLASPLPLIFWYHAVTYATIISNCLPTQTIFGYMSPIQAKYGIVPDVHRFKTFGCIAFVHVDKSLRESTLVEKAYEGYFIGFPEYPYMEKYAVYVPALDDILESVHVNFDEVTSVSRPSREGLLTISDQRQTVNDFKYLTNFAYVDDESNIKYVTTRVTISRGFIVAYRAPIVNGLAAQEEHRPVHAKDVEKMLNKYLSYHSPEILINNQLTTMCNKSQVAQPRPASQENIGSDQPIGDSLPGTTPSLPPQSQTGAGSDAMLQQGAETSQSASVPVMSDSQDVGLADGQQHSSISAPLPGADLAADLATGSGSTDGLSGKRQRQKRQPLNVHTFGDIREKLYYLASEPVDSIDDKDPAWDAAKLDELYSVVIENDVWDTAPLPEDKEAISTKWVVKEKVHPVPKKKARYTTRGFSQRKGIDYNETYAPVAKLATLRIFLSIVAIFCLFTRQLDVKTAFLNAKVVEDIYISPAYDIIILMSRLYDREDDPGHKHKLKKQIQDLKRGHVFKLKKALYGLKQAPRNWYLQLDTYLRSIGFAPNRSEPCLYSLKEGDSFVLLLLYVDDILIGATTEQLVIKYTNMIGKTYRISNEGAISTYLNIGIEHQRENHIITMCMESYVEKMCKRFDVVPKMSVTTPMQENIHLEVEEEPAPGSSDAEYVANFQYREKIGSVLYYMICMRPDIAYSVSTLARFCEHPTIAACRALTRLLQYCFNTKSEKLTLGGFIAMLIAFFDADWAADKLSRRSIGGHIVFLGWGPIDWNSKMHKLVCNSTAESEFIASNGPARTIQWIRWLLYATGITKLCAKYSSVLYGDNKAAIAMAENPVHHQRTKHIAIKYYYIRDLIEYGVLTVLYVESAYNCADIFTKPLGRVKFLFHRKRVLGGEPFEKPSKRARTIESEEFK